jgi:predicted transcriptional regulator
MKNRNRYDIIANILQIVLEGDAKRTRIMYGANLAYDQLKEFLAICLRNGLIEERFYPDQFLPSYAITEKGKEFLTYYVKISVS